MSEWTQHTVDTARGARVPVRVYGKRSGAAPVALYLHGGAFTGGSAEASTRMPALIAQSGAVAVSADYPLAPAHPFPHAAEAMFDVLGALQRCCAEWASRRSLLFVGGEEAGGNIAAAVALMARDRRMPLAGQILVSPMLDPVMGTCSLRSADVGEASCPWAEGWRAYLASPDQAAHPYAAPINATRLSGVAPALVITAEDDPLRDESETYAYHLKSAGVRVQRELLPAPTNWPLALSTPANDVVEAAPWSGTVVGSLKNFFASVADTKRVLASTHPAPV